MRLMEAPRSPMSLPPAPVIPEVLNRIAYCESRDRQYDENGDVVRGVNPHDLGRYQINITHWGDEAKKQGFDLHTEEGNEAMALYLYRKFGTKPWHWSQKCWDKGDQAYTGNQ